MKLKHDEPPSNFAVNFNLRRYTSEDAWNDESDDSDNEYPHVPAYADHLERPKGDLEDTNQRVTQKDKAFKTRTDRDVDKATEGMMSGILTGGRPDGGTRAFYGEGFASPPRGVYGEIMHSVRSHAAAWGVNIASPTAHNIRPGYSRPVGISSPPRAPGSR